MCPLRDSGVYLYVKTLYDSQQLNNGHETVSWIKKYKHLYFLRQSSLPNKATLAFVQASSPSFI